MIGIMPLTLSDMIDHSATQEFRNHDGTQKS
jgi:hypothetical protein